MATKYGVWYRGMSITTNEVKMGAGWCDAGNGKWKRYAEPYNDGIIINRFATTDINMAFKYLSECYISSLSLYLVREIDD